MPEDEEKKEKKKKYFFNFTQDLKISQFDESLKKYVKIVYYDKIREMTGGTSDTNTPNQYKSKFFFKPYSNTGKLGLKNLFVPVIINYIKKFQFPEITNEQTRKKCIENNIFLAPNRIIFILLANLYGINSSQAYLTEDEVFNYVYLRAVSEDMSAPDIDKIIKEIITGREQHIDYQSKNKILEFWNQPLRQYPEDILPILTYTGLVYTDSNNTIYLTNDLNEKQKSYLYEIITYKKLIKQIIPNSEYADYMDITDEEYAKIMEENNMPELKEFENFEYKVFDTNEDKRYNRIIFGAPGTGKSHKIDIDKEKLKDIDIFERVTFHPNYTYSQFVGTYKPVTEGKDIAYKYVEGPFMRLLTTALENAKDKNKNNRKRYLLIIEEINRANVAAVFGDMFQLLDRKDGVSEYEIQTSEDVRKYLADKLGGEPENYKTLKLPNNFYIWATMNSADQGVQPMDAAFKRRWDFEYLNIDSGAFNINIPIPMGTDHNGEVTTWKDVDWNDLRNNINNTLKKISGVNEDKLLGPFFIGNKEKLTDLITNKKNFNDLFKSKVLMYLYEDVVKMQPSELFNLKDGSNIHYSDICKDFDAKGLKIFVKSIYNQFDAFKDGDAE